MIRTLACLLVVGASWTAGAAASDYLHRDDPLVRSTYSPHVPLSQRWAWVQANCQPPSPEPVCRTLPSPR